MREQDAVAPARRPAPVAVAVLTAAAMLVAMWPYTAVVTPGVWTFVIVAVIAVITVIGMLVRLALAHRSSALLTTVVLLAQLLAANFACTRLLASESAMLSVVPTLSSLRLISARLAQSAQEITEGVAPIPATLPMATLLGLAFAVTAILLDQLIAHRLVLLAIVLSSTVGVFPMLISFGSVNIGWFLMQAAIILLLLRFGARYDRDAPREASLLTACAAGATAVLMALVLAPALPVASALPGAGPVLTVSADLRLGDDLRRPDGVEALTLVTSGLAPPYLRVATLSRFNGEVWRPDRLDRVPLREGFGAREWSEEIATVETDVSIRVVGVSSDRLPVPYAPERLSGVQGTWSAVPENRTVLSRTADASGADYTVSAATPRPTLEQIRASTASGAPIVDPPLELPEIIGELAREVTAGADTDYDRLIALQDWFRAEFSYSLDAPVEEGFDGTGADAVATFLSERAGYCIHFAGAFALMAQTLDMPVRVVVGYLPGSPTDQRRGKDIVYSVTSDKLHSWPEVHFEGIGWIPFEPTATLGVPTAFVAASAGGGNGDGTNAPSPTATPSTAPSSAPTSTGRPDDQQDAGGGGALRTLDPTPVLVTVIGALTVLLLPALVRASRRRLRLARAHAGDAVAAWRELNDSLADLGIARPQEQTARALAATLGAQPGVDAEAMGMLVDAIERASYAQAAPDAGDLSRPLRIVLTQLRAGVDGRRRLRARLLPVSLVAPAGVRRAQRTGR